MSRSLPLSLKLSGTALEKEMHLVEEGLQRRPSQPLTFDAAAYEPRAVERARVSWEQRMFVEHRSTTVFSNLAAQLFEANASLDAKLVMLRMAQDEVRHTVTAGRVVQALGGKGEIMHDADVQPLARHAGVSPEERALRNVLYTTSMSEMVAVAMLVDELDRVSDPYLHESVRQILSDEILHGQFGFHYLEAWRPWLDEHPDALAGLERYLQHAFVIIEGELAGPAREPRQLSEDEKALGLPDGVRHREIFYGTVEEAIVPGLERLGVAAGKAWKSRKRLD